MYLFTRQPIRVIGFLILLVLATVLLFILLHRLPGMQAIISGYHDPLAIVSNWSPPSVISGYHGPVAVVSNWGIPNVISTYHGPTALVSGYHSLPSVLSRYN